MAMRAVFRRVAWGSAAASAVAATFWWSEETETAKRWPLLAEESRDGRRLKAEVHSASSKLADFYLQGDPQSLGFQKSRWNADWDAREPQEGSNSKMPRATRHLLLIRHGHYDLNGATDEERKLTELGREQATATGLRLARLGLPYTRIIRSNMTRAVETAALISDKLVGVPQEDPDPILREGAPCRPEPDVGTWKPEADYFVDGCRIEAAFRKYFHRAAPDQTEDSYELVVCHANVIRYFLCRALQVRLSISYLLSLW